MNTGKDSDGGAPASHENTGARILLVEDDPIFRSFLRLTLKQLGYSVVVAEDGKSALKIASGNMGIQLLITDVIMPGMNGTELAKRVKEILPRCKVLYISGCPLAMLADRFPANEITPFLRKPFPRPLIDDCVRGLLFESGD